MSNLFELTHDDLAKLELHFPHLKFDRQEQVEALLHAPTNDFQAAPGSGKTTLLGAKLALMAARWPHARRGICILTHTNVAREEIEHSLKVAPHGDTLLGYPHFIGTIQTFVNKYLALPWLRTLGIEMREIDEEDFADRFFHRAYQFSKGWIEVNRWKRESSIRQIRYQGADLELVTDAEEPLPASGEMLTRLRSLKAKMANDGRLRHADLFAYAEQALAKVPGLAEAIQYRFPSVFIDEMQDTNDVQLSVLTRIFNADTTLQRFGDINQSILNRGARTAPNSFPTSGSLEVRTSLRFDSVIAGVVNSVKVVGEEIDGQGPPCIAPPTLILYSDKTIQNVIPRFGTWVGELLPKEVLEKLPVKAVCAIKAEGNQKQKVGRYIADYFPSFDDTAANTNSSQRSVRQLFRLASLHVPGSNVDKRSGAARAAILLIIQKFGSEPYRCAKTWRELMVLATSDTKHLSRLRDVVLDKVLGPFDFSTEESSKLTIAETLLSLGDLIDQNSLVDGIPDDWLKDPGVREATVKGAVNTLLIEMPSFKFPIHIATIASVKGETHLATLILESCRVKKYDIKSLLPFLCGTKRAADVTDDSTLGQLMNIFVGASRPRRLLAFAMHIERSNEKDRRKLEQAGWSVLDWTVAI